MAEINQNSGKTALLQAAIDEVSTRLVVDGFGEGVIAALRQLSQSARSEGFGETAILAAELCEACTDEDAASKGKHEAQIQSGLKKLQDALAKESRHASPSPASFTSSLAQDPELVNEFVSESREHLASIEAQMLVLEQTPEAKDAIHAVFRGFHTIKGLAGFLDFAEIQKVAHEVETLLDRARNDQISVTPRLVDVVLEAADYLKAALLVVEAHLAGQSHKAFGETAALVERIQQLSRAEQTAASPLEAGTVEHSSALEPAASIVVKQDGQIVEPEPTPAPVCLPLPAEMNIPVIPLSTAKPADTATSSALPTVVPPPAPAPPSAAKETGDAAKAGDAYPFWVRVDTSKLDYLMEAVGELVITQSILRHCVDQTTQQDPALQGIMVQLARITADVQRTAMGMRMVPIGQLFQRSNRIVRDLARKLGKNVTLDITGEGTEVDKTIAEELADPLLHMLRNAVDHGVEMPANRIAAGKNPMARLGLHAYHKGAQIVIEISDDGKGLDRTKILAKAVEKGLVSSNAQLTDSEVFALIFEPGFSTATQVTDLSGRGVGMDVVRRNLSKLRGEIDIESTAGKGSTFFLRLPLTMAIIEGLVVKVADHRFIIPVFAVREVVRVTREMLSTFKGRNEMAMIRGQVVPIIRLNQKLGINALQQDLCEGLLVITELENRQFGIWINDLLGRQEVVIKTLGEGLKDVDGVAGCAILGDGRVGLILDVAKICRGAQ